MTTLPYTALRMRSSRHTGRTVGFRGFRFRRRLRVPYAALPQRRAVSYPRRVENAEVARAGRPRGLRIVSVVEVERPLVVCRTVSRLVRSSSTMVGAIAVTEPMVARCKPPVAEPSHGSPV